MKINNPSENLELRRERVEQCVEEMIKIEEEYHAACLRKVSNLSRKILRLIDEEYEFIKKERSALEGYEFIKKERATIDDNSLHLT